MKSSFCIDLQRFMLIPTKFPLTHSLNLRKFSYKQKGGCVKIELPLTSILTHPFYIFRDSACFTSKHLLPFV